ncbi:MAG: ABC transporter ATP-binding protein [Asgard group archaeon]|nr:ABC transporter ATP-binding protein [Asgard group archaeon]
MATNVKYTFQLLKKYLKPYAKKVIFLAFLIILANIIQVFSPQLIRMYIDAALAPTLDLQFLLLSSLIYIGINLVQQAFTVVSRYVSQDLAWATTNDLRVDLTIHCMNLDMTFHNKKKTGEMIERIDGDATTLSEFFSTFSIYFAGSFFVIFGVLIAIFIEGWIFGLIFVGFVIIAFVGMFLVRKVAAPLWKKARESTTALFGNIEESISGLEDVRANGANAFVMKRFHEFSQTDYKNKRKAIIFSRVYFIMTVVLQAIINVVILVVSYYFSGSISAEPGQMFLLLSYGTTIMWPIRLILWQLEMLQNSIANIERIKEFFEIETKIKDDGEKPFPLHDIALQFDKLNFGYKEDELVLQNINFNLQPGKKIGLIGKTGSGKTTIARLVFRLYDPINGNITINGTNAREIPLRDLRQNIAYVTQDVELFKASIKDNITFFNKKYTDEQVIEVIHELGLKEWFDELPNGLETEIFSEELGLSAGEEQLLALTRAFLKNPKIVILDEASSRLDPATERQVDYALDKLLTGRSAIIIAHRLQTLQKVDEIMLLQQGEIVEYGQRTDLVNNPESHYSQLLQKGMESYL